MRIRDPARAPDVVVVVPARDESARIATCLRSVRISLQDAVAAGAVARVAVAVVGHRCGDDTLGRAGRVLAGLPHALVADRSSITVGDVRALGVRAALDLLPAQLRRMHRPTGDSASPREVWILNTDADSVVPPTWVRDVLVHAAGGQQAVIGMTTLSGSGVACARCPALAAYHRIIRAGLNGRTHDHVYGANLAVRADAYTAVGGFPSVPIGEDRALSDALVAHALPVARPREVVVTTSARRTGRVDGGLASLLGSLDRAYAEA